MTKTLIFILIVLTVGSKKFETIDLKKLSDLLKSLSTAKLYLQQYYLIV